MYALFFEKNRGPGRLKKQAQRILIFPDVNTEKLVDFGHQSFFLVLGFDGDVSPAKKNATNYLGKILCVFAFFPGKCMQSNITSVFMIQQKICLSLTM